MPLKLHRVSWTPNWVLRGTLRGVRIQETTGTTDKKIAEEIRAKREAEVLAETVYGRAATATFAAAALSYIDNGGATRFLKRVSEFFGETALSRIDQDMIDEGARRTYPHASDATRNRQWYTVVSAVITHAAKRKWCAPIILERPPASKERVRWLTIEEALALIAACSDHLKPLVIFLLYTGARVSEALWLDWKQVDLTRAHVSFEKTKNGEARGVPLHANVIAALANLPHRDGEVFRRPDGHPYARPEPDSDVDTSAGTRIKTAFRAACRRAGITDFHPHDCRHTWATWHYAANRNLGALQKLGGWKSVRMVMRYTHVNVGELADTIDRLPGWKSVGPDQAKSESSVLSIA